MTFSCITWQYGLHQKSHEVQGIKSSILFSTIFSQNYSCFKVMLLLCDSNNGNDLNPFNKMSGCHEISKLYNFFIFYFLYLASYIRDVLAVFHNLSYLNIMWILLHHIPLWLVMDTDNLSKIIQWLLSQIVFLQTMIVHP